MVKRLLTLLILGGLAGIQTVSAQCTPNTSVGNGFHPASLPLAQKGTAYSTTITFKVPKDTTISGVQATVHTIEIDTVMGLPTGFTYTCGVDSCKYSSNVHGCLKIEGTPHDSLDGKKYDIQIGYILDGEVVLIPGFPPQEVSYPGTENKYFICVGSCPTSIEDQTVYNSFDVKQNMPNPFNGETVINFTYPEVGQLEFKVVNLLGKEVYKEKVEASRGLNNITFSANLGSGVYLYSLSDGKSSITKRMIISSR